MRRVFADTFFYLAALNRRDAAPGRAVAFAAAEAVEVVTTVAVLLEVGDAMAAPDRRGAGGAFLAGLRAQGQTRVRPVDEDLLARGLALYRERPDKAWSLTDCISFVVMKDEGQWKR